MVRVNPELIDPIAHQTDVIRVYQRKTLEEEFGMINLAVLRDGLSRPFKDQVMAT